jgi:DNA-binding MarR family transcriptional regulator
MEEDILTRLYTSLHRLGRQMHRYAHTFNDHGNHNHHQEQFRLLSLISKTNGAIQRDLAGSMDVRPSSMTEMVAQMERLGYIKRQQDEKDQRIIRLFLTDKGKLAVDESRQQTNKLVKNIFAGFNDSEIEQLLTLVSKLCNYLDQKDNKNDFTPHLYSLKGYHQHHSKA